MSLRTFWITGVTLVIFGLLSLLGCRQAPSDSPKYYQREIERMRRQEVEARQVEPAVKDWYPWRGKPPYRPQPGLTERISEHEQRIKCEIGYLNEVIRGKTKVRVRFRD